MYSKNSYSLYYLFIIFVLISSKLIASVALDNCEMIKLSYIKSDYALGVLKAVGYDVIEFESVSGETEDEYTFSPTNIIDENSLTIVKMPENNSVSLDSLTPDYENDDNSNGSIAASLGGSSFTNKYSGEPLQRLLVCYPENDFNQFSTFYSFLKNEIDIAADQILIEALVIEIDSEKLNEFDLGLDNNNNQNSDGSQYVLSTPSVDSSTDSYKKFLLQFSSGGFFDEYGNPITEILDINLSALLNSRSAEILSKPSVLVLDGRQARIQIGRQIPIIKTIIGSSSQFAGNDVEYIPVGISLNLIPRISEDKRNVTMQVETIITEIEPQANIDAPTINNRRVESFIRVANNTPFIIGGLISNKKSNASGSIPLISKIPLLGKLFSSTSFKDSKKEVIVVITPHIISDTFNKSSRVIPKDSKLFDSVENRLFPNSYRLKESDIFDLNFITSHEKIQNLTLLNKNNDSNIELFNYIENGGIPGEEILVRRMLYNVIERENYFSYINPKKVIFFDNDRDGDIGFINDYNKKYLNSNDIGLLIKYNVDNFSTSDEFIRPSGKTDIVKTSIESYKNDLVQYNASTTSGNSILLNTSENLRRLYEVLILKEVLSMNPDLNLSINEFKAGLEIQFPAKETLESNTHVIDSEIAKYFYEINDYYLAFQKKFNKVYNELE